MKIEAIDSLFLAVAELDACGSYERLGLKLSPASDGRRTLLVGGDSGRVAVHFLAGAVGPMAHPFREALAAGRPLFAVGLRVSDLDETLRELEAQGIHGERFSDGEDESAWLRLHEQAGTDIVLLRNRHADAAGAWQPGHSFPVLRLDHLAAVAHDLEAKTRFWADTLGIHATGEVTTPTMVIRQLRIGDAVMELLGPTSPESPIMERHPGLIGMASWEVVGLDVRVAQARTAGFAVTDPAAGPLPGTRIATVPGAGLAGVNMQMIEYIR